MKPVKLPILTKINDTFNSTFEDNINFNLNLNTNPNTVIDEHKLRNSQQDEISQMLNYLKTEDDIKFNSTFYRKKNMNQHGSVATLRRKLVNPSNIIEEVKQKYDFHMRMKELSRKDERDDFNSNNQSNLNSNHHSQSQSKKNIKFHYNNKLFKSSQTQRERGMVKIKVSELRDLERTNNMEKANKQSSISPVHNVRYAVINTTSINNTITNSTNPNVTLMTSLEKGGEKGSPKMSKIKLNHTLKLNEMSFLLSQNKHCQENILLHTLVETFSSTFPEKYEKIHNCFKYSPSFINSENKQIQMFLVVLEILSDFFSELESNVEAYIGFNSDPYTGNKANDMYLKIITILDAIFVDFCRHLSLSSIYRSDFLKKIWLKKMDYLENLMNNFGTRIEYETERVERLLQDNRMLGEIIEKSDKEKEEFKKQILMLNKENQKWLEMVIEKDTKEKELKQVIEDLQKEIEEKSMQHTALVMKVNKRASAIGSNVGTNVNLSTNNSVQNTGNNNLNGSRHSSDNNLFTIETIPFNIGGQEGIAVTGIQRTSSRRGTVLKPANNMNCNSTNQTNNNTNNHINDHENASNSQLAKSQTNNINMDYNVLFKSRQARNSVLNRNLKAKISDKEKFQFEKRKVNIVDNNILNLELKDEIINALLNNNNQFQRYMNKGFGFKNVQTEEIGIQTDIQVSQLDSLPTGNILKNMKDQSVAILDNIESLSNFLFQFEEGDFEEDKYKLSPSEYSESKTVLSTIRNSYSNFIGNFTKMSGEMEIIFKDIDVLRNELEKTNENTENMHESYSEIFKIFLQSIKDDNTEIVNFLQNKCESKDGLPVVSKLSQTEVSDLLNKILERNSETVEKEEMSPIFKFIPKPDTLKHLKRNSKITQAAFSGLNSERKNNLLYNNNFREIYQDFKLNKTKIKASFTLKKVIKVINTIYFDMLEKIYFKKDKTNFDNNDDFIEFPEIMHIYFSQNFGLESLKKSKFLDFLASVLNYESNSKRVSTFSKLILIHKYTSNPSLSINDFDTFVSRQLLLLIQMFKNNNIILKSPDENNTGMYLIQYKLNEIIMNLLSKFAINTNIKNKINSFIEKNKKNFSKNMKVYLVVDFDDLIELMADVLTELKNIHSLTLKKIYRAVNLQDAQGINFFEFLLLSQYIFSQKLTFDQAESLFKRFSGTADNKETMLYEHFETITIEGDLIDDKMFNEYLKIQDPDHLISLFKMLQEELKGSALSIFDDMNRRLFVINKNYKYREIMSHLESVKNKITNDDMEVYEDIHILWISIRIFDSLTLDIYNDHQLFKIFKGLDYLFRSLEEISGEKKPHNLIIRLLRGGTDF